MNIIQRNRGPTLKKKRCYCDMHKEANGLRVFFSFLFFFLFSQDCIAIDSQGFQDWVINIISSWAGHNFLSQRVCSVSFDLAVIKIYKTVHFTEDLVCHYTWRDLVILMIDMCATYAIPCGLSVHWHWINLFTVMWPLYMLLSHDAHQTLVSSHQTWTSSKCSLC